MAAKWRMLHVILMAGALLSLWSALAFQASDAASSRPVDPLRRPSGERGSWEYTLSYDFTSLGYTSMAVDASGAPHLAQNASDKQLAGASARLHLNRRWAIDAGRTYSWRNDRSALSSGTERRRTEGSGETYGGIQFQPAPDSLYDPGLSLRAVQNGPMILTGSISLIRDPIVLSGRLGFRHAFDATPDGMTLATGIGFVANETITAALVAEHTRPMSIAPRSQTVLSFTVDYAFDDEGDRRLGWRLSLVLPGVEREEPTIRFGVEWRGRQERTG